MARGSSYGRNAVRLVAAFDGEEHKHFRLREFENVDGLAMVHASTLESLERVRRELCSMAGEEVWVIITDSVRTQADLDSSDLQPAIESELRGFADLLDSDHDLALSELTGWPDWFATHFIQRQASLNLFYIDVVEPMLCLSKLSEEDVAGPEGEGAGEHNCFEQSASVGMSWFPYNLTGKRLVSGMAGGAGYIHRVHDYNALVALVRYQLAILEGRDAAPEQYLPEGRTVDKSESSLAVDCLERQSVCRIEWR